MRPWGNFWVFWGDWWLGGGFKYFLCSPLFGEDEPILTNIFQMGWNHQLDELREFWQTFFNCYYYYCISLLLLLLLYSFLNMFFFGPMFTRGWRKCWGFIHLFFAFQRVSTCFGLLCFLFARNNVLCSLSFFGRIYVEGCLGMSHLSMFITSTLEKVTNGWNHKISLGGLENDVLPFNRMMFRFRLPKQLMALWNTRKNGWCDV